MADQETNKNGAISKEDQVDQVAKIFEGLKDQGMTHEVFEQALHQTFPKQDTSSAQPLDSSVQSADIEIRLPDLKATINETLLSLPGFTRAAAQNFLTKTTELYSGEAGISVTPVTEDGYQGLRVANFPPGRGFGITLLSLGEDYKIKGYRGNIPTSDTGEAYQIAMEVLNRAKERVSLPKYANPEWGGRTHFAAEARDLSETTANTLFKMVQDTLLSHPQCEEGAARAYLDNSDSFEVSSDDRKAIRVTSKIDRRELGINTGILRREVELLDYVSQTRESLKSKVDLSVSHQDISLETSDVGGTRPTVVEGRSENVGSFANAIRKFNPVAIAT